MIPLAIALALGFIIGDAIRKLRLAILSSVVAGALIPIAFAAVPLLIVGAFGQVPYLLKPLLAASPPYMVLTLIGMYFGRRRALKGYS